MSEAQPSGGTPDARDGRSVAIGESVLSTAGDQAASLRGRFAAAGTFVVNLISAPGSGKTELVCRTAERLRGDMALAAVAGDVQTALDAERIAAAGIAAAAIETHGSCHLSAARVAEALAGLPEAVDLLFVENVGNLVCPSSFDLGEDAKIALVSVCEGDDKPAKYPAVFSRAAAFVVSKLDLATVCESDLERMARDARRMNPDVQVFALSARTGEGMDRWCDWLRAQVRRKKG